LFFAYVIVFYMTDKAELPLITERKPSFAVSCEGCGACCRSDIIHILTPAEANHIRNAGSGTAMERVGQPDSRVTQIAKTLLGREITDYYELESDCGALDQETRLCSDYENRPVSCAEFPVGSFACRQMRVRNGVDELTVFHEWLDSTKS